jgi:hypothetical protein
VHATEAYVEAASSLDDPTGSDANLPTVAEAFESGSPAQRLAVVRAELQKLVVHPYGHMVR